MERPQVRSQAKLEATRHLLTMLGNPQQSFPAVHVTGTSGKGSTAAMIAAMLGAAGYRVGLRTSPYLQVATEKLQVGSVLIDARDLNDMSALVLAARDRFLATGPIEPRLGYAEVWSAMAFLWFQEQMVDIAVIEVGAGGRFDATNVFDPVVSVITNVGLDHVASLGPGIADIAWHKAGIIKPSSIAIVGDVPMAAWDVIHAEAELKSAKLVRLTKGPHAASNGIHMAGRFQRVNADSAVAAAHALHDLGFHVTNEAIARGLAAARLPGRLERMPSVGDPVIWLDGAHNADKIAALAGEVRSWSDVGQFPVVVIGVLAAKDAHAIVKNIAPVASAIVATEPQVLGRKTMDARDLAEIVREFGSSGDVRVQADPHRALQTAETLARSSGTSVLVTGSMYLAGGLRRRWYPDDAVVTQQTSWPSLGLNRSSSTS